MEKETNDPLASLFISDAQAINRKQLTKLVNPFLSIDRDSKEFTFLPAFSDLEGSGVKIEILLAGAKARSLYLNEPDGLKPVEIIEIGILATGSVKSGLRQLLQGHKIKKDKEGRYFIPSYRIPELINQFSIKT